MAFQAMTIEDDRYLAGVLVMKARQTAERGRYGDDGRRAGPRRARLVPAGPLGRHNGRGGGGRAVRVLLARRRGGGPVVRMGRAARRLGAVDRRGGV